jgi:hypothetical protein
MFFAMPFVSTLLNTAKGADDIFIADFEKDTCDSSFRRHHFANSSHAKYARKI